MASAPDARQDGDGGFGALIPSFRVVPPSPAQLSAEPDAPHIVYFEGERELLQVATSAAGLGIDLTSQQARIVVPETGLRALLAQLDEAESRHAAALRAYLEPVRQWQLRTKALSLDAPVVMGILNLTDDSFSGDGVGRELRDAMARAETLRAEGADIIDLGAETARADRPTQDEFEEAALVGGVTAALAREGHTVSTDTYKAGVARAALNAGAELVNDISGLTGGTGAAEAAAEAGAAYVLNYSFSAPKRRPNEPPQYSDVVTETVGWLGDRLARLKDGGLRRELIAIDPGIAFGKSHDEDLQILRRLGELRTFGQPVVLAHSRKNYIGSISGGAPAERDLETRVTSVLAYAQGVRVFRVHDVAGTRRALAMATAIVSGEKGAFAPGDGSWPWRAGVGAAHMTTANPDRAAPRGQRW